MEETLLNTIEKHLLEEEKILWSGKSNYKIIFDKRDIFFIPITVMVGIYILGAQSTTFNMIYKSVKGIHRISFNDIVSLVFLLICMFFVIYLIIGRFIMKLYYKKKTMYLVTNKRILIIIFGSNKKIISKYINQLSNIDVILGKNGVGKIIFDEPSFYTRLYGNTFMGMQWNHKVFDSIVFYDVQDVKRIYELVQTLKNKI